MAASPAGASIFLRCGDLVAVVVIFVFRVSSLRIGGQKRASQVGETVRWKDSNAKQNGVELWEERRSCKGGNVVPSRRQSVSLAVPQRHQIVSPPRMQISHWRRCGNSCVLDEVVAFPLLFGKLRSRGAQQLCPDSNGHQQGEKMYFFHLIVWRAAQRACSGRSMTTQKLLRPHSSCVSCPDEIRRHERERHRRLPSRNPSFYSATSFIRIACVSVIGREMHHYRTRSRHHTRPRPVSHSLSSFESTPRRFIA